MYYKRKDFDDDRATENASLRTEMGEKYDRQYVGP